ncbi:MAG: hypothetical protein ACWA6X_11375 [Bauldia sp.]|jgi:hypothetical protein
MTALTAEEDDVTDLVTRFRRVVSSIDLDRECLTTLSGALSRFTALEWRRQLRKSLAEAREKKDQIISRIAFLAELDELNESESDRSVFAEMALLFDEISEAAIEAARAMRLSEERRPAH